MQIRLMQKPLFAKTDVNTGRQIELDIARALAIIFMVLVHVQMYFSIESLEDSNFGYFIDFMGGVPAAPVFMFLMGVGFLYSRNSNSQSFIKRGIKILIAGYILNILRGSLPALVDYLYNKEAYSLTIALEEFLYVDILQFAGLTMIFWGIIKWARVKNWMLALIGMGFTLLNFLLLNIQFDNYLSAGITALFWGSSEFAEFPFLTWIFYPIAGYFFAMLLKRCIDKKRFYTIILVSSTVLLLSTTFLFGAVLNLDLGMSSEMNYYHHTIFANLVYSFFVICWISIIYFISAYLPKVILMKFTSLSLNVTEIYFIHWIIIGWLTLLVIPNSSELIPYLFLSAFVFFVAETLTLIYMKRKMSITRSFKFQILIFKRLMKRSKGHNVGHMMPFKMVFQNHKER